MSSTKSTSAKECPPTLYDETHRGIWHTNPHVASMGNLASLIAHLEHHYSATDGSFAVCIAGGSGNFISKKLYESIPQEHRPELDNGTNSVSFIVGADQTPLGTTFIPIILENAETGKPFRIVLHAYVLPRLLMGMFISHPDWIKTAWYGGREPEYGCDFGDGKIVKLKGLRHGQ